MVIKILIIKSEKVIHVKVTSKRKAHIRRIKYEKDNSIKVNIDNLNEIKNIPFGKSKEINGKTVKHGYKWANGFEEDKEWAIISSSGGREKRMLFPDSKSLCLYVHNKIERLKFKLPEVKNKKIAIVPLSESKYGGQDMGWTEQKTGEYITDKDEFGYHYSSSQIKKFGIKEISMVNKDSYRNFNGVYGYRIKIPKGTKVKIYGQSEIRVNLNDKMEIKELKSGWNKYNLV